MNKYKLAFWFFTTLVFFQSLLPINNAGGYLNKKHLFSLRLDYWVHFILFLILMFLLKMAYFNNKPLTSSKTILLILMGLFFAFTSELLQLVIPYRAFNIKDLVANIAGVLVFVSGLVIVSNRDHHHYIIT
jgi:VanZ family protein